MTKLNTTQKKLPKIIPFSSFCAVHKYPCIQKKKFPKRADNVIGEWERRVKKPKGYPSNIVVTRSKPEKVLAIGEIADINGEVVIAFESDKTGEREYLRKEPGKLDFRPIPGQFVALVMVYNEKTKRDELFLRPYEYTDEELSDHQDFMYEIDADFKRSYDV